MKTRLIVTTLASLIVGGFAAGTTLAQDQTVGEKLDDATLVARIKADLLKSRNVDGLDVNVDVKDGQVTLSGQAGSEAERIRAEQIAKDTSGVKGVQNKIAIKAR